MIFVFCVYSTSIRADVVNEFIQVQCLKEINALKVDIFNVNGEISRKNALENYQNLWDVRGVVLADSLIKYNSDNGFQEAISLKKQCVLRGLGGEQKQIYNIDINTYLFSGNLNSQCGLGRTFEINITTKNQTLVDRFRFQYECFSNQKASSLTLLPHEGYIIFDLVNSDTEDAQNDKDSYGVFFMRDQIPITSQIVYGVKSK